MPLRYFYSISLLHGYKFGEFALNLAKPIERKTNQSSKYLQKKRKQGRREEKKLKS